MTEKQKYSQLEIITEHEGKSLEQLYEDSFRRYDMDLVKKDEDDDERVIDGRIVRITDKDVIVDVGLKSEGVLHLSEFPNPEELNVGDEIKVYIENFENEDGFADISLRKAIFISLWPKLRESNEKNINIDGIIRKRVKGGMIVDLQGVEAFLPGSQIDLQPVADMDKLINLKTEFRVIKLNYKRRNIVVSRRVILENEKETKKLDFIENLKEGDVLTGTVKNITEFGAFIEIERGIDGLLYITDMSWGRILHPSELVAIGDDVKVMVTSIDREKGRISLGMKQLTPYPWEDIEAKYPIGSRVKGKVISLEDYGAFVELEKGVEGLIHISEMSWTQHLKHPSEMLSVGDDVEAIVLSIDKKNERISLGLKQLVDNPWDRFNVNDVVKGKITRITKFGAFVEIAPGIEGLLHISNVSWDNDTRKPEEVFNKNEDVEAMIVNIDSEKKRISLGIKQMQKDPIDDFENGSMVDGKIVEVKDKNILVELDNGVRGLIPQRLIRNNTENLAENYKSGESIQLKITDIDKEKRRIILTDILE